jgi:23S rRNA (adenine2503-C2)-methyltransferase
MQHVIIGLLASFVFRYRNHKNMALQPVNLTDLSIKGMNEYILSIGEAVFRAKQIREWVFDKLAAGYNEMVNLPAALRQKLTAETNLHTLSLVEQMTSLDGTVKTLFQCYDGNTIESALMFYSNFEQKERRTVCVSTQAGCGVGCPFCATGRQGFQRNLTPGEIIDQVLFFGRMLKDQSDKKKAERVSNIVFMGMGEPLANYENLWQAIETLNSPEGFGIGARNMTISTSGVIPGIQRLSKEKLQIGLAISLHAANNELRNRLVPLNKRYPLEKLLPACREYSSLTGRRLSFEYIMLDNINDSIAQARELAYLLRDFPCHVNLIPNNNVGSDGYLSSPMKTILAFENELKKNNINVTLRESRGQDISAGCGQLRSNHGSTPKKAIERITENV